MCLCRACVIHDMSHGHARRADHGSRDEDWVVCNKHPPGHVVGHSHDSSNCHHSDHHREVCSTRRPARDCLAIGQYCIPFAVVYTLVFDPVEAAYACLYAWTWMRVRSGQVMVRSDRDYGHDGLSGGVMRSGSRELLFGRHSYSFELAPNDQQHS